MLAPFETKFLTKELKGLDVQMNAQVMEMMNGPVDRDVMQSVEAVRARIRKGDRTLTQSAQQAYRAFLGYYNGQLKRVTLDSKAEVVEVSNQYSKLMGLDEIPSLEPKTVGKMGLKGVPGLNIMRNPRDNNGGGRGGRGRGGGGRGGPGRGGPGRGGRGGQGRKN